MVITVQEDKERQMEVEEVREREREEDVIVGLPRTRSLCSRGVQ